MFVVDLTFDCYQDTTLEQAEQAINRLVNALRFNGQIIGEEFPTVLKDGYFITRVMCPTEDAMHPFNNSAFVKHSVVYICVIYLSRFIHTFQRLQWAQRVIILGNQLLRWG